MCLILGRFREMSYLCSRIYPNLLNYRQMEKRLRILLALCGLLILTSCGEILDALIDDPVPSTPGYSESVSTPDSVYVAAANQPNATYFMPAPPNKGEADFIDDEIQWKWGQSMRVYDRGKTAREHMGRTPKTMAKIMAKVLGLSTISKEQTPALERLLHRAFRTGQQSCNTAKVKYNRQRPFVMMGESAWYADDAQDATGSFTSATTAAGWAVGLVFAEMWPPMQNDILKSAFKFGEDRVVSGSNFQSDVDGGYLCGAASIAIAHTNPQLERDITDAREEYKQLKGLASSYNPVAGIGSPEAVKILNSPVKTTDPRYEADLKRYEYAKTFRETARGTQAVQDAESSTDRMALIFGEVMGINISVTNTPAIYTLIQNIRYKSVDMVNQIKWVYFRARPYVQLHESTPVPGKENTYKDNSSYPSGHACFGWSVALALAEVAPARQNQILNRAWHFGYNRVIVGYHWPTDVDAGRLIAASLIAHMHTDSEFANHIKQAQAEYQKLAK